MPMRARGARPSRRHGALRARAGEQQGTRRHARHRSVRRGAAGRPRASCRPQRDHQPAAIGSRAGGNGDASDPLAGDPSESRRSRRPTTCADVVTGIVWPRRWRVRCGGPRPGLLGLTSRTAVTVLFVRPSESMARLRVVALHEAGHAWDFARLDPARIRRWCAAAGASPRTSSRAGPAARPGSSRRAPKTGPRHGTCATEASTTAPTSDWRLPPVPSAHCRMRSSETGTVTGREAASLARDGRERSVLPPIAREWWSRRRGVRVTTGR